MDNKKQIIASIKRITNFFINNKQDIAILLVINVDNHTYSNCYDYKTEFFLKKN